MPYMPQGEDVWLIPNKDSARHYRWLSKAPRKLGLWLRSYGPHPGYTLERGVTVEKTIEHAKKLGFSEDMVNVATNRIEYGDNVLASIPVEEYVRRKKEKLDLALERFDQKKDEYLGQEIKGVRTFIEDADTLEDKARHARRDDRPISGQTGVGKSPALRRRQTRAS